MDYRSTPWRLVQSLFQICQRFPKKKNEIMTNDDAIYLFALLLNSIFSSSSFAIGLSNYFRAFSSRSSLASKVKTEIKKLDLWQSSWLYANFSSLTVFKLVKKFLLLALWVIEQIFKWKWVDCQRWDGIRGGKKRERGWGKLGDEKDNGVLF